MIPLGVLASAPASPGGGGATLADAILALSPVGYWPLTETTGTTANDLSGNGRNGTYTGAYTLAGAGGHAVFSGGYVSLGDQDAWSIPAAGLSMFAVVRTTNSTAKQFILAKGKPYEWGANLVTEAGWQKFEAVAWEGDSGANIMDENSAAGTVFLNTWRGVAAAMPYPAADARFPVYVGSGIASGSTQGFVNGTLYGNYGAELRIGGRATTNSPFTGAIGHVAIFHGQITATQVGELMAAAQSEGLNA